MTAKSPQAAQATRAYWEMKVSGSEPVEPGASNETQKATSSVAKPQCQFPDRGWRSRAPGSPPFRRPKDELKARMVGSIRGRTGAAVVRRRRASLRPWDVRLSRNRGGNRAMSAPWCARRHRAGTRLRKPRPAAPPARVRSQPPVRSAPRRPRKPCGQRIALRVKESSSCFLPAHWLLLGVMFLLHSFV